LRRVKHVLQPINTPLRRLNSTLVSSRTTTQRLICELEART